MICKFEFLKKIFPDFDESNMEIKIKKMVNAQKKEIEIWRTSEGIPYPRNYHPLINELAKLPSFEIEPPQPKEPVDKKPDNRLDINSDEYDYEFARREAYGHWRDQLEFIGENGITKYREWHKSIKSKYPKNKKKETPVSKKDDLIRDNQTN